MKNIKKIVKVLDLIYQTGEINVVESLRGDKYDSVKVEFLVYDNEEDVAK